MKLPDIQPIDLLRQLEQQSQGNAVLGEELPFIESWRGFTFAVDELNLAIPFMGQYEIFPCGECWPLPMVKPWVRGMTNIRGEVYTVIDFAHFIGRRPVGTTAGKNLLVLSGSKLKSALVLENKISLRSFDHDIPRGDLNDIEPDLRPFLNAFLIEGLKRWCVLDMRMLTNSEAFANIGR